MPQLQIDVTQTKSFDPIPEGRYTLRFASYEIKTSKGKKTNGIPAVNATFEVVGGEYDGSKLWSFMLVSGKYAFTMKEFLAAALGEAPKAATSIDPDTFIGVVVEADVLIDPNSRETGGSGDPRNEIKHFYPVGGDGPDTDDDLDEFFSE